jgi:hypothetical protein
MGGRRCTGKTKAGTRCKARPLKGTERCAAHPLSPAFTRFGSPEQASAAGKLGGRPRLPRPHERLREIVEAELEDWLAPYREALEAQRAIVVGTGDDAELELVPDHRVRMRATREVLDRVYGRPRIVSELEVSGPGGDPIRLEAMPDLSKLTLDERRLLVELLDKADVGPDG